MKKLVGFTLITILVCFATLMFASCDGGEFVLEDYKVSYASGTVKFEWEGTSEVKVYKYAKLDSQPTFVESFTGKSFSVKDMKSYFSFAEVKGGEQSAATKPFSYLYSSLGANVNVFTPSDDQAQIQEVISGIYERTAWEEFSSKRQALLFMQGDYDDVNVHVGYYTSAAGLGYSPEDTRVGEFEILQHPFTGSMLTNFWRTVENFSVKTDALFCVSQATSMRRMSIDGDLLLTTGGWGSGGFISDTRVAGTIKANDSTGTDRQQQWLTRNSSFQNFTGGQMNMVFVGTEGTLPSLSPAARVTNVEQTGFVREKPFVVFDQAKGYGVFLPDYRYEAVGNSWESGATDGVFIPLSKFYVADAERDTADTINAALSSGSHLLFSPGVYYLDSPISIKNKNTIVTGLGLATLAVTEKNTEAALKIADVGGVNVSSLLFEAGAHSDSLVVVGEEKTNTSHEDNPICIADLFFRSGGTYKHSVWVDQTIVVNSNNVFGDNFWMWRADHSFTGNIYEETMRFHKRTDGSWVLDGQTAINPDTGKVADNWAWDGGYVGWSQSYGRNGVIINGDDVTMYGLMVEHYMEYQTIWNGENGLMCFYQSETPYDAPNQSAWMRNGGTAQEDQGWASYKIGDHVQNHTALGVGVYYVNTQAIRIMDHAIEAPANSGILIKNMVTARFGSPPAGSGIRYIINNYGQSAFDGNKRYLSSFNGGTVTA